MKNALSTAKEWIICIVIAVILTFLLKTYLFDIVKVSGHSMDPTLTDRDMLGVEKITTYKKDYKLGDIITFDPGDKGEGLYIKRVIGTPGDTVEIKNGYVYVNNKQINESYLSPNTYTESDLKITVEQEHLFVLGDNRNVSEDSRAIGLIPIENIKGHAVFRFLPLGEIGPINNK